MEIITVTALLVALAAVAWALRQSSNPATPPLDNTALAQHIGAEVKAQMSEVATAALEANNKQFLTLADQKMQGLQAPFDAEMKKLAEEVGRLEESNKTRKGAVDELMKQMGTKITELNTSTVTLSEALRSPTYRGSWGEQQLRNVIEMSGMIPYCDFEEQTEGENREGNRVRPDVRVRLPNGAHLAIDAKTPFDAYARAQEATDPAVVELELKAHAKALKSHVDDLASKKYWEHNDGPAPEYVILFVPGESFLADAARARPELLAEAMNKKVLLASPVNLLALLWAVHRGWQEARISENAREIAELGEDLYNRVGVLLEHVDKTGRGLNTAVNAYNKLVGSVDGRLMPSLRKFPELGVGSDELSTPQSLEALPQQVQAAELPAPDDD